MFVEVFWVIHPKSGVWDVWGVWDCRDTANNFAFSTQKTLDVQLHCTLYCINKGNSKCQSAPTAPNVLSLTEEDIIGKKNCIICWSKDLGGALSVEGWKMRLSKGLLGCQQWNQVAAGVPPAYILKLSYFQTGMKFVFCVVKHFGPLGHLGASEQKYQYTMFMNSPLCQVLP